MTKFLFGVATSSHQIEGDNKYNDWWFYEEKGKYKTHSGKACNSYEMYKEDNKLVKSLGCNSYRFSIEWSRIEKSPRVYDDKEIAHYVDMIDHMIELGIEPMVTLHHFTNPIWFELLGGWTKKSNAQYFVDYVRYLLPFLKGKVKYLVTFNEPNTYVSSKYLGKIWHPYENNIVKVFQAWFNIIHCHRTLYILIKKISPHTMIGFSVHCIKPKISRKRDLWKLIPTNIAAYLSNHFAFSQFNNGYLDFLGVQFYSKLSIKLDLKLVPPFKLSPDLLSPNMIFNQHARDLLFILKELKRYKLPVIITENGYLGENDEKRCEYLTSVFEYLDPFIKKHDYLIGYYYWSLLDNYEWGYGFKPKFGLFSVNPKNFERTAKPSANVYKEIIKKY